MTHRTKRIGRYLYDITRLNNGRYAITQNGNNSGAVFDTMQQAEARLKAIDRENFFEEIAPAIMNLNNI